MRVRGRSALLVLTAAVLLGLDWPGQGAVRAAEFATAGPGRRAELLHLLAPSTEPEAQAAMTRALTDEDPMVRETARRLAVRFPTEGMVAPLTVALGEADASARVDALDALAGLRSTEARRAVERALSDRSATVRAHAVRALSHAGAEAVVPLLDRVHDPEGDVRAAAATALGDIGDARAALAVVGISQDPIPEVRVAAARALGRLRAEVSTRTLLGLVYDAMPEVRAAALDGLGRIADPATVPTLAALARPNQATALAGRDELARAAVRTLGGIDAPAARHALLDLALDRGAMQSGNAATALLEHPERLRGEVAALLPRVNGNNVGAVAELLGRVGGDEVADALLGLLLRAERPSVTDALLRALGATGSDRALRVLLERLTATPPAGTTFRTPGCPRGNIDPVLIDALGRWDGARGGLDPLAVDPLAEALGRVAPSCHAVLSSMVPLLGATGNERAVPTLMGFATHADPAVRTTAVRALGRAVGPSALGALVGALSDGDDAVRAAASSSLRAYPADVLVPVLAARWRDPQAVDRGGLLLALGHSLAGSDVAPALREAHRPLLMAAASAGAVRTRSAAVRALGELAAAGDGASLRAVLGLVHDARLGGVAVEALGNLPPAAATAEVREALRSAVSTRTTGVAAAWALRAGGAGSVEALTGVVAAGASPAARNALAALSRVDLTGVDGSGLRAAIERLTADRDAASLRGNACAVLRRVGGSCDDAPVVPSAVASASQATDLRLLDAERRPVTRPVLVVLGDQVSIWTTPDADGWVRVSDAAPGALRVVDRGDDDP